jgi:carboxyl-terminal processing protease
VEKPGDEALVDAAVEGMLASLEDSSYVNPDAASGPTSCTGAGCLLGEIGLDITMENGLVTVVSAFDDTPAARARILSRDIVAEIDGETTQGLNLHEAASKFAGAAGATIRLKLIRRGQTKPIAVTLTREAPLLRSVAAHVDGDDVGYLRVAQFDDQTTGALKDAIATIAASVPPQRLKGYVLDLRNSPGGLPDAAVGVAQSFLDSGDIVAVRGRQQEIKRFSAGASDLTKGKPLMLLVNGGSAAAAEIVAGALQDNKRATIVGTRSFGKGSATSTIALGQAEGAIRLTTGRYFTPSGRPIDASGIKPDVEARQDVPDDLKSAAQSTGERQSYIPPAASADKALNLAYAMLRGAAAAPAPN